MTFHCYALKFSIPEVFWNIERYRTKCCGTVRKKYNRKTEYPPCLIDTPLCIPEKFRNTERKPYKIFRSFETKIFSTQLWCRPLLCMKTVDARDFLTKRRVSLQYFWHRDRKKIQRNLDSLIIQWKVWHQNISEKQGSSYEICRQSEKRIFYRKNVKSPLTQKKFGCQNFCEKQEDSLTKFFVSVLWDKNFFNNNLMPPSTMRENFR